jgi:hypothetical protein
MRTSQISTEAITAGGGVSPPPPFPCNRKLGIFEREEKRGVQWCYCCRERKRGESGGRRSGEA